MEVKIEPQWKAVLESEFHKPYFEQLVSFVKSEYHTQTIYPPGNRIFQAFEFTPFDAVKVVVIGQDPYHGPGQANGLSFSVNDDITLPPSLKNIYKELEDDLGIQNGTKGNLSKWAKQGVLLLNATLTVRAKTPGSHQNKGWETFTDAVIQKISEEKDNIVFILWGAYAQKKGACIDRNKHCVIESPHPSPFSVYRGFYGSKPFSKTNVYLENKGKEPIDWKL